MFPLNVFLQITRHILFGTLCPYSVSCVHHLDFSLCWTGGSSCIEEVGWCTFIEGVSSSRGRRSSSSSSSRGIRGRRRRKRGRDIKQWKVIQWALYLLSSSRKLFPKTRYSHFRKSWSLSRKLLLCFGVTYKLHLILSECDVQFSRLYPFYRNQYHRPFGVSSKLAGTIIPPLCWWLSWSYCASMSSFSGLFL